MKQQIENIGLCKELAEKLSEYIDGELNAKDHGIVENHLVHCDACRLEMALIKGITKSLNQIPEETLPSDFAQSVAMLATKGKDTFSDTQSFFEMLTKIFTLPRLALAASSAFMLAVFFFGNTFPVGTISGNLAKGYTATEIELVASAGIMLDGKSALGTTIVKPGNFIEATGSSRSILSFPNRSRVTFGKGSKLACLPNAITLDEGLISVDVPTKSKDHQTPSFRVFTANARFTVWGTKFTVQYKKLGSEFIAILNVQEGVVGVERLIDNQIQGKEELIEAGMTAKVSGKIEVKQALHDPLADTTSGSTPEDTAIQLDIDR